MEGHAQSGTATSRDRIFAQERVSIDLRIDEATMALLLHERDMMGDEAVEITIRRRLTKGLLFAIVLGPAELKWRPVHRDSMTLTIDLSVDAALQLEEAANDFGYGRDVLVATVLSNDICKPMDVVSAESRHPPRIDDRTHIRRAPGRGNLYPMHYLHAGLSIGFHPHAGEP